jgi:predicted permease
MCFHLEMKVQELVEKGVPEDEAHWVARREFGNRSLMMEDSRGAWRFTFLETLLQDIRYGLRTLGRNRVFTAAVILTLALGIGANTALFTLVDAVMLRPLPVERPDQLVLLGTPTGMSMIQADSPEERSSSFISYPLYRDFREHTQVFSEVTAISSFPWNAYVSPETGVRGASVARAHARVVAGNFFSVLGIRAAVGRTFTLQDNKGPGANPVVVFSHAYWSKRYGKDPSVIGRPIRINGIEYTVVGITPPEFFGVTIGMSTDMWVPMMMQAELTRSASFIDDRNILWLRLIGRKEPGVSREQAAEQTEALFHQLVIEEMGSETTPEVVEETLSQLKVTLTPFGKGFGSLRQGVKRPLLILMGVVGLVLLIACANVGNLLLARASGRQREVALRLALGSSRSRLLRQLLTESLILALAGGCLALLTTWWAMDLVLAIFTRRPLEVHFDGRIWAFTLVVSGLAAVFFGLAPALRSTKVDLITALRNLGGTLKTGSEGWPLRKILVVSQVAVSLLLLVGAGLFLKSLENLRNEETGFRPERVLLVDIDPQGAGYDKDELPNLYETLLARLGAIPSVQSVSLSYFGLFSGAQRNNEVFIDSYVAQSDDDNRIRDTFVTEDYFAAVGVPILLGRGFLPRDRVGAPKVAIVNETFARHYFGDDSPIGKRFGVNGEGSGNDIEIVGVARDLKYNDFREETPRFAYYPVWQDMTYLSSIEIRTSGAPEALTGSVRQAIAEAGPDLPILDMTTLNDQIDRSLRSDKLISRLTSFFGLTALLLASIGLYGVMAYGVTQRTNEIGIRIALGAGRLQVLWMVLKDSIILVGVGVLIGLPAAMAATRLTASLLYGLGALDPIAIFGATGLLCVVAALAGYLPARKASCLDPTKSLRYE